MQINSIVKFSNDFNFNPAYKVTTVGKIIALRSNGKVVVTGSSLIMPEEYLSNVDIPTARFNIDDIVCHTEGIGVVEAIHFYHGHGMFVGEDRRGDIEYTVTGYFGGSIKESKLTKLLITT